MLVFTLVLGQLVCVLLALFVFRSWMADTLNGIVQQRAVEVMQDTGKLLAAELERMDLAALEPGSASWTEAQSLIQASEFADGAYPTLVDPETWRVICHPDPAVLAEEAYIGAVTEDKSVDGTNLYDALIGSADRQSTVLVNAQDELLVPMALSRYDLMLLIHQPRAPLTARLDAFMGRVWSIGAILGFVLVAVSGTVSWVLLKHYESRLASHNATLERKVADRTAQIERNRDAIIYAVARVAESRDEGTGQHLERISQYTRILAEELQRRRDDLDPQWVRTVGITSILHDVGKVGIPDEVLLKPGKLTEAERATIERHPFIGGDTLMAIKQHWGDDPFLVTASEICFAHHERWDGQGYPFGLAGDAIPLSARIVALADVYDALTSARPYKQALPHDEVVQRIRDASGTHFDPQMVEAFLAVADAFDRVRHQMQDQQVEQPKAPASA